MQTEILTKYEELEALRPAWQELLQQDKNHTIFQTPEWLLSCYKFFENDAKLSVITVQESNKLVGLAPFVIKQISHNGLTRRVLTLLGSQQYRSDYSKIIIANENTAVLEEIMQAVFANKDWDILDLYNITTSANLELNTIQELAQKNNLRTLRYPQIETPAVILASKEDQKKLLSHTSQKRHTRYFQNSGDLRIEHLTEYEKIVPLLQDFFAQHITRWQNQHPSLFLNKTEKDFFTYITKELAEQKYLLFTVIYYNDSAIAFHFGFQYQGVLYWYKPSYDISLAKHSPGEVLQLALFEYAVNHNFTKFDFTIGDEKFKYRFANSITHNERLLIYRHNIDYFLQYYRKLLAKYWHQRS